MSISRLLMTPPALRATKALLAQSAKTPTQLRWGGKTSLGIAVP
jgi:hypothetical protein